MQFCRRNSIFNSSKNKQTQYEMLNQLKSKVLVSNINVPSSETKSLPDRQQCNDVNHRKCTQINPLDSSQKRRTAFVFNNLHICWLNVLVVLLRYVSANINSHSRGDF